MGANLPGGKFPRLCCQWPVRPPLQFDDCSSRPSTVCVCVCCSHAATHCSVCEPICEVVVQERCDIAGARPTTQRREAARSS